MPNKDGSPSPSPQTSFPSFVLPVLPEQWIRANAEDDSTRTHQVPSENEAEAAAMVLIINNLHAYLKTSPSEAEIERYVESHPTGPLVREFIKVHHLLSQMVKSGPDGWQSATTVIVPFLFATRLSVRAVQQVEEMHARHEPLDETRFAPDVPREPLNYLFQLVRRVDREPQRFMFGFVYSTTEKKIVPICSSFCGATTLMLETLDRLAEHAVVHNMRESVETPLERAMKPDEKQQKRDAVVIIAVLQADIDHAKRLATRFKAGERGRLLIVMHGGGGGGGVSSKFQPLDDDLRSYLRENTNPLDRTLEWMSTCDLAQNMVVTVQDGYSPTSPQRSYVMVQPWIKDEHWFEEQEGGSDKKDGSCRHHGCSCNH